MRSSFGAFVIFMFLLSACGAAGVTQTVDTASYRVTLTVADARFGDRGATVAVQTRAGAPVENAAVALLPTMPSDGMASPEVLARPLGNGRYQTDDAGRLAFTMLGEWQIAVRVTVDGQAETALFVVQVAG